MDPKLLNRLRRRFSEALLDHRMIAAGDHILVGLSGGKDSWALLGLLADLAPRSPAKFRLSAVTVDGGLTGFDPVQIEAICRRLDVPFHLVRQPIFNTVAEKKDAGSAFCSMCAKLRRGILYSTAEKLGATKVALGHHLDDALETLLLNLFFGGRLAALPPVLLSNAGHVPVIRPLLYCEETDLAAYAAFEGFPVVGCACPICPTHPDHEHYDLRRKEIKAMISRLKTRIPDLHITARGALKNLEPERFFDTQYSEKA